MKTTTQMEIAVKDNEKITWDMAGDWVQQLRVNLNKYTSNGRRKSKSHDAFATKLTAALTTVHSDDIGEITTRLLPVLLDRSTLSQTGWNRKQSYLYVLCDSAIQQFFVIQKMASTIEAMKASYEQKLKQSESAIRAQSETIDAQSREIKKVEDQASRYEEELGSQQGEIERYRQGITSEAARHTKEYEALRSQHETLKIVTTAHVSTISARDEEIAEQKREIQRLKEACANAEHAKQQQDLAFQLNRAEVSHQRSLVETLGGWVDDLFQKSLGPNLSRAILESSPPKLGPEKAALIREVAETPEHSLTENFKQNFFKKMEDMKRGPDSLMGSTDSLFDKGITFLGSLGAKPTKRPPPLIEAGSSSTPTTPGSDGPGKH